jgi:type I restriction enzyme M protein
MAILPSTRPGELIQEIGDSLLAAFRTRPLVDEYGVYEQLMSYWNDVMHDDVALIMSEGWDAAAKPRPTIENKERKLNETPDLVIGAGRGASKYKMDLLPPAVIVTRYFATERAEVDELNALAEQASQAVEEFIEENSGEEGPLADAMDDDKISKVLASAHLKVAKYEDPRSDEVEALSELIGLYNAEAEANRTAKDAQAELDRKTLAKYAKLATEDIQSLVIDDKWGTRFVRGAQAELAVPIRKLVDRLYLLGDRYSETLGALDAEVERLSLDPPI